MDLKSSNDYNYLGLSLKLGIFSLGLAGYHIDRFWDEKVLKELIFSLSIFFTYVVSFTQNTSTNIIKVGNRSEIFGPTQIDYLILLEQGSSQNSKRNG